MAKIWNGGGVGNLASTGANWVGGVAPVGGDDVVFDSTSSKNCTWDIAGITLVSFRLFGTGDYAGILTNIATPVTVTGACDFNDAATFVLGTGCTWNVGTWNETGTGTDIPATVQNWNGAVVNVTGTGNFGFATSAVFSNPGTLNILLGADCTVENAGDFAGMNTNNFGTMRATSEFNLGRYSTNSGRPGTFTNKSTGLITGAGGTLIQCGKINLVNEGTINITGIGSLAPESCTRGMPGTIETYACQDVIVYATLPGVNPAQTHIEMLGTQIYTGPGNVVLTEDQGAGSVAAVKNSGSLVFHQTAADFQGLDVLTWTDTPGIGSMEFVNVGNFKGGTNALGNLIFSGGSPTLTADLICQSKSITGGTFSNAGFNVTIADDSNIRTPGQIVNTGLNGSAWNVGGSLLWLGASGELLNAAATAGWTLNVAELPYTTANASFVNVKNCNASGGKQIQADQSTDGGSNSNWNFAPAPNRPVTSIKCRVALTQSAGTKTLEARLSGATLGVYLDGEPITGDLGGLTINQAETSQGLLSYFDGSYQQSPLDYFFFPDPSAAPTAPTGLAVNDVTALATWHPFPGATSYSLRRSPSGLNTWTVVGTPTLPTFQDSIPASGDFDYEVAAVNSNGLGAYSAIVTVTYVLIFGGVEFVRASSQSLSRASNASFNSASDWTMAYWCFITDTGSGDCVLVSKSNAFGSGADRGWWFYVTGGLGWVRFRYAPADDTGMIEQIAFVSIYAARHYVEISWDATAKLSRINIDDGALTNGTNSNPAGLANTTNDVTIGNGAGIGGITGIEGPVRFWSRLLTSGERTAMYNGGSPLPYASLTSGQKVGLQASWDWANNAQLLEDSTPNANTLTNHNGVTIANLP